MEDKTNSDYLKSLIIEGMQDKKATDIVVLDLKKVKNAIADYFIICTGNFRYSARCHQRFRRRKSI